MLGNTPMMKQYQEIKDQYPDTILFFRLGDFYEMFGADAILASKELEITLTGRDAGMEERVPMCGVPYHAADNYISRLIQKGYKVTICEQVEDAKLSKGLVKREVIRVITPGTALDIQEPSSVYLTALSFHQQNWGLAFCDVSTGEFWLSELSGAEGKAILKDELLRLNPAEILIPENEREELAKVLSHLENTIVTSYNQEAFSYPRASQVLYEHFHVTTLEELDCQNRRQGVVSAGAILQYLQETQKSTPQQIKELQIYYPEAYLALDAMTFRNLELTTALCSGDKKGSLLNLLDQTKTACGARLLRHWLQTPLTDRRSLEKRLDAVESFTQNWAERQNIRTYLEKVYDLERLMTRILYGRALPRELIALKNSLVVLPEIKNLLNAFLTSEYLTYLKNNLDLLEDVWLTLDIALEEENSTLNLKDGGVIKKGYNKEIDELREASANGKEWMAQLESEEKEKTGIKSLKIGFNKVFGYYFEVTKANLNLVPDYFQRKQTLANGERYITEELLKLESMVLGAEEKLLSLEEEIYKQLLKNLGQAAQRVQHTSQVLAQLDVLQSLAEIAVQNSYIRPQLLDKEHNIIHFEELRHPVVEKVLPEAAYVPNELHMPPETDLYIITGPNMGGKSTYCRSVALAVILAQMGSFVPAKKAVISLRDRVFARVGANDDLRSGQSTFMVEMNEVANILNHATKYSLVILDEVGRGTSTYDGMSMAWAVSEYLIQSLRAKTLFATHYHELTSLSTLYANVQNLSVSVKEKGEEIIFLHKIIAGAADRSYGIQVAKLAGLPLVVIERAKEILANLEKDKKKENKEIVNNEILSNKLRVLPKKAIKQQESGIIQNSVCLKEPGIQEKPRLQEEPDIQEKLKTQQVSEILTESEIQNDLKKLQLETKCLQDELFQLQEEKHRLEATILKMELLSMTPLEALNQLYHLQQQIKKSTSLKMSSGD